MVFKNLGEDVAKEIFDKFVSTGMNEEDAWNEVYSIECKLDDK